MALPKLGYPTFELELPSTGITIKYRPFLVKEEKVLLMALESKDEKQVVSAVKDLIKNCVITRIKVDNLPSFDLEYLFLKIRGASIGENIILTVTCLDDNETQVEANININDVEIFKPEGHDKKIMFDENTGLVMKYPSMKEFVDREFLLQRANNLTKGSVYIGNQEPLNKYVYKSQALYKPYRRDGRFDILTKLSLIHI